MCGDILTTYMSCAVQEWMTTQCYTTLRAVNENRFVRQVIHPSKCQTIVIAATFNYLWGEAAFCCTVACKVENADSAIAGL